MCLSCCLHVVLDVGDSVTRVCVWADGYCQLGFVVVPVPLGVCACAMVVLAAVLHRRGPKVIKTERNAMFRPERQTIRNELQSPF